MRRLILAAALLPCLYSPARAEGPFSVPSAGSVKPDRALVQFLSVYTAYAQAIKDHGTQGLREFAAPNFALRSQGRRLTGEKAFMELSPYLDYLHDARFTVSVRPLTIRDNSAVALTRETSESAPTSPAGKQTWRLTWYWKQTWRKTVQGWKLAASQKDERKLADRKEFTFTTAAQDKDAPAAAQDKDAPAAEQNKMTP